MDRSTTNPILGRAAVTVPGFEVDLAVSLAAMFVENPQPAGQLIACKKYPVGVISQQFADFLRGRGLSDETTFRCRTLAQFSLLRGELAFEIAERRTRWLLILLALRRLFHGLFDRGNLGLEPVTF